MVGVLDFVDPASVITAQTEYVLRETSALHTGIERDILAEFRRGARFFGGFGAETPPHHSSSLGLGL
jgi:hypothetical protein